MPACEALLLFLMQSNWANEQSSQLILQLRPDSLSHPALLSNADQQQPPISLRHKGF
jgi:hypothetical protein